MTTLRNESGTVVVHILYKIPEAEMAKRLRPCKPDKPVKKAGSPVVLHDKSAAKPVFVENGITLDEMSEVIGWINEAFKRK